MINGRALFTDFFVATTLIKWKKIKGSHGHCKFRELRLPTLPRNNTMSMASTSLSSQMSGYCLVNVQVERQKYFDVKLPVLPDLCAAAILG